jgi:hypothetical protein
MGGNALKTCVTRRYSAQEYHEMVPVLLDELRRLLHTRCEVIASYSNKQSFGDVDVVVSSDNLPTNWIDVLVHHFKLGNADWVKNSNVFSFARQELQVDLIITAAEEVDAGLDYFAYNDLGNLLGRMMHKLGIKYGHRGLSLVVRAPGTSGRVLQEIMLCSENVKQTVSEILGVDPHATFDELTDIFEHVASSSMFDPDIYLLDNRNHTSRTRDRKRKTYSEFLEWIRINQPAARFKFQTKTEHGGYGIREPFYTDIVLAWWPWVEQVVNQAIKQYELDQEFAKVYNGELVSAITGLTGKNLGGFMQLMRIYTCYNSIKLKWIAYPDDATRIIHSEWLKNKHNFTNPQELS